MTSSTISLMKALDKDKKPHALDKANIQKMISQMKPDQTYAEVKGLKGNYEIYHPPKSKHYFILDKKTGFLGAGAFGPVYKVFRTTKPNKKDGVLIFDEQEFVLKTQKPNIVEEATSRPEEQKQRNDEMAKYALEADACKLLYDNTEFFIRKKAQDDYEAYLISDFLPGKTLFKDINSKTSDKLNLNFDLSQLTVKQGLHLAYQAVKNLYKLHAAGFYHGDISHNNFHFTEDQANLFDFGTARKVTSMTERAIAEEMGTEGYLDKDALGTRGPGEKKTTIRKSIPGDIFAMSGILSTLLGADNPFRDKTRIVTDSALLNSIKNRDFIFVADKKSIDAMMVTNNTVILYQTEEGFEAQFIEGGKPLNTCNVTLYEKEHEEKPPKDTFVIYLEPKKDIIYYNKNGEKVEWATDEQKDDILRPYPKPEATGALERIKQDLYWHTNGVTVGQRKIVKINPTDLKLEQKQIEEAGRGLPRGFKSVSLVKKEPTLDTMLPNTLMMLQEHGQLTAYWIKNGKIENKSFSESAVENIVKKLPKGKSSMDVSLIDEIISQYGIKLQSREDQKIANQVILQALIARGDRNTVKITPADRDKEIEKKYNTEGLLARYKDSSDWQWTIPILETFILKMQHDDPAKRPTPFELKMFFGLLDHLSHLNSPKEEKSKYLPILEMLASEKSQPENPHIALFKKSASQLLDNKKINKNQMWEITSGLLNNPEKCLAQLFILSLGRPNYINGKLNQLKLELNKEDRTKKDLQIINLYKKYGSMPDLFEIAIYEQVLNSQSEKKSKGKEGRLDQIYDLLIEQRTKILPQLLDQKNPESKLYKTLMIKFSTLDVLLDLFSKMKPDEPQSILAFKDHLTLMNAEEAFNKTDWDFTKKLQKLIDKQFQTELMTAKKERVGAADKKSETTMPNPRRMSK